MSYEDELLARRMDWDQTGWCRFLPWEGALLWRMLCEATEAEVEGDLDTLVEWYERIDPVAFGPDFFAGLDTPIEHRRHWSDRRRLTRLFDKAGLVYPETARQTAEVGACLGLYLHTAIADQTRWRVPVALPLPTEVLPMNPRQRQVEDDRRQHLLWSEPASVIVEMLRDVGCPEAVTTTVDELAELIGEEPETIRHSLAFLNDTRFSGHLGRPMMRFFGETPSGRHCVDPERLSGGDEFQLVPNWRGMAATYGLVWELLNPGEDWLGKDLTAQRLSMSRNGASLDAATSSCPASSHSSYHSLSCGVMIRSKVATARARSSSLTSNSWVARNRVTSDSIRSAAVARVDSALAATRTAAATAPCASGLSMWSGQSTTSFIAARSVDEMHASPVPSNADSRSSAPSLSNGPMSQAPMLPPSSFLSVAHPHAHVQV